MSVMRVEKDEDFTVVSNFYLKDKRLSLKAKGLLTTMLSLPEDWVYSIEGLTHLSDDGKCSILGGIKELEKYGYLRRKTTYEKGTRKFSGNEYNIYEMPFAKIREKYGDFRDIYDKKHTGKPKEHYEENSLENPKENHKENYDHLKLP